MVQSILDTLQQWMQTAQETYAVDPVIFLAIYFISVPFFYYSLFRMVRAIAARLGHAVMLWSAIFLCANVAPFVYVLFFGKNLPWWVYAVLVLLIGQGVYSVLRRLSNRSADVQ
jgi:hypothetical protein